MKDALVDRVINLFATLPGIGPRSAARIVFYLLGKDGAAARELATELLNVADTIHPCEECGNLTRGRLCGFCSNKSRDRSVICVVESCSDIEVIERSGLFKGLYHVLGGRLAPLDGVGPEDLSIERLLERIRDGAVKEIILATSPSTDGDTTALYLQHLLESTPVTLTRPARGLPSGSTLEFVDELTMRNALENRRRF